MRIPLKWIRLVVLSGCVALTGVVGYFVGAVCQDPTSVLPVQRRIPFEYYLNEHSFSEIENTKATLEALGQQFLTELQSRHHVSALGPYAQPYHGDPLYQVDVPGAIQELQAGIEQFKGTGQELRLVRELLFLLKREKQLDRWLDLYLATLYEHPTHPLIGSRAKEAQQISEALGRQYDLASAFDLLRHIPLEFGGKDEVGAVSRDRTAATDHSPPPEASALEKPLSD